MYFPIYSHVSIKCMESTNYAVYLKDGAIDNQTNMDNREHRKRGRKMEDKRFG